MKKKSSINQEKYDKAHAQKYPLKLNRTNDKDIIDAIDPNNKQGSIKKLIRKGLKEW